jgi:hypothetical protein
MKQFKFVGSISGPAIETPDAAENALIALLRPRPPGTTLELSMCAPSLADPARPGEHPLSTPGQLMYLLDIYRGQFDDRVRAGQYRDDQEFARTIQHLVRHDLVRYYGDHVVSPKGTERILAFLMDEKGA